MHGPDVHTADELANFHWLAPAYHTLLSEYIVAPESETMKTKI